MNVSGDQILSRCVWHRRRTVLRIQSLSLRLFATAVDAPKAPDAAPGATAVTAAPVRHGLGVRPATDVSGTDGTGMPGRRSHGDHPSSGCGGARCRPDVPYGCDVVFRRGMKVDVEIGEVQYLLNEICPSYVINKQP